MIDKYKYLFKKIFIKIYNPHKNINKFYSLQKDMKKIDIYTA